MGKARVQAVIDKKPVRHEYWTHGQELGSYLVRFRWDSEGDDKPTWIDFEVHEVVTQSLENDDPQFQITDELCDGTTDNPDLAEPTVSGFVKWDGCTQIYFPSEPAIHADGQGDLTCLFNCLLDVRTKALEFTGTKEEYF